MALLSLLAEQRALAAAARLGARARFDDAMAALHDVEGPRVDAARHALREAAIAHYGAAAERAAARHEGRKAQHRLERAARFVTPPLRSRFHGHARAVRLAQVRATRAPDLVELVDRAETERARWYATERPEPVPHWATESHQGLLRAVGEAWGLARMPQVHEVLYAPSEALRDARAPVQSHYAHDLADAVPRLGDGFVQAVVLVAAGRPDLAALPLAEAADDQPLVAFERARVAHLLDLAPVASRALAAFAAHAHGHRTVRRRLHSAVFHAQMALACGHDDLALRLLEQVPAAERGGRPTLMLARLRLDGGDAEGARDLLLPLAHDRPDLGEARRMLDEAVQRLAISL